jgi:nucleotide-binding universal stress UspA family protein
VNEKDFAKIRLRIENEANEKFNELENLVPSLKDVTWESVVRRGTPYEEGLIEIEDKDYDLLVIGSHGRRGVKRFLYGSTAEKMLRNSPISVHVTRNNCTGLKK